jgi:hypothetical protein
MHEIRITLPRDCVEEVAAIAQKAGIRHVAITDITLSGSHEKWCVVSAETSTPKARHFMDGLLTSRIISRTKRTITSRELRALIGPEPLGPATHPMVEPAPDALQDLWQLNHVTPSYVARAAGGAILLADGILNDNIVAIVVAALFLPFLSQVLATGFGVWAKDWPLVRHGLKALLVSALLAVLAGAGVALIEGGPILYDHFRSPAGSFFISSVIGVTAGFCTADDAGRRYLIGVAGAVQLAIFPVWWGAALILGLPAQPVLLSHVASFAISLVTIFVVATVAYASLQRKNSGKKRK